MPRQFFEDTSRFHVVRDVRAYAPAGMSPVLYSAIYTGSHLLEELIVSAILTYIIIKRGLPTIYLEV
jgi:thiamine transporter ThiT